MNHALRIEPNDDSAIVFDEGIIGIPGARRFQLLERPGSAVLMLRCLDADGVDLPVVDPFLADPSYRPRLGKRVGASIGLVEGHDVLMFAIAALQPDGPPLANLRAPLVINASTLRGVQVILDDTAQPLRAPIRSPESAGDLARTGGPR